MASRTSNSSKTAPKLSCCVSHNDLIKSAAAYLPVAPNFAAQLLSKPSEIGSLKFAKSFVAHDH
jgi:hypothetical protein